MNAPDKDTINKVIEGAATKEQAKVVTAWFSTTVEGQEYLSSLISHDIQLIESGEMKGQQISNKKTDEMLETIFTIIRRKTIRRYTLRVAAVLIPFVLFLGFAFYTNSQVDLFGGPAYAEIYVPKGEQVRFVFQDGSEAYLNADTKIRYPKQFGLFNRKIYLEGEAFFKIATNKKRPFIVNVNNSNIEVTGTSFNVKAYKHDELMEIVLEEGKITFNTPQQSYSLLPGQLALYDKKNGLCTIKTMVNSSEASMWKDNYFVFRDTPLAEVLKIVNRRFDVDYNIRDTRALKYSYTITTRQTSIEKLVKELEIITPVKFNLNNNVINISLK
ncbi:MAG: FecR domain-containing protein [Bacteroidales bacterium]|nr:FecR domain-containing protein [Bacteroidales bacterium]